MRLNDDDLLKNKNTYSIEELEKNVKYINKKIMLATQTLDARFCIQYILDMDIDSGSEDSYIYDIDYILYFQKHLNKDELIYEFKKKNK
jgi:hypothetical protein